MDKKFELVSGWSYQGIQLPKLQKMKPNPDEISASFSSRKIRVAGGYRVLVYTTQVNSAFHTRCLANSEVISQVLFTSTSVNNC